MSTITMKHFDKLAFVDEAKNAGADERFARVIADKLEQVTEMHSSDLEKELHNLATKADLVETKVELKAEFKADMKELELRLIKWQIGIGVTMITSIVALIKLFH